MGCSDFVRACRNVIEDTSLPNIDGVVFQEEIYGYGMVWVVSNYTVVITVLDEDGNLIYYSEVEAGESSEIIPISTQGKVFIQWRTEDGALGSEWADREFSFTQGQDAILVLHRTVQVDHIEESVLHTRVQRYFIVGGSDDFLITQDGDFLSA